jgi:WD40 repeat protein
LTTVAWFGFDLAQLKDNGVRPVGQKKSNPFGLFDTLGNVWELCRGRQCILDSWERRIIVTPTLRGGAAASSLACASESRLEFEGAGSNTGFRVMRESPVAVSTQEASRRPDSSSAPGDSIVFAQRKRLPLSTKAIVSRPAKIPGVRSWSVELAGHQRGVLSMTWIPKGDLIATAAWDGTVRLWDREGQLQKALLGHDGAVCSVAFSPDGSLLASSDFGQSGNQVRIWDVATGACLGVVPFNRWIRCVSFSPNGEKLAIAVMQGRGLAVLSLKTGRRLEPAEESTSDYVAWSPDGSRLMSRKSDGPTIRVWDGTTLKKLAELQVSDAEGKIVRLEPGVWSPDGHSIAAPCSDDAWRIWDGNTFELRKTLKREGDAPYRLSFAIGGALLFWKQNGQLVTPLAENRLLIWDVEKGEVVAEVDISLGAAFAPSPDKSEFVSWHQYRPYLDFLDAATGKSLRRGTQIAAAEGEGVQISPDGQQVVTAARGHPGTWNANTGQPVARNGNAGGFSDCTWQPSGGLIVGSNVNNPAHVLPLFRDDTLASVANLRGAGKAVSSHAWSPDGKLLAAADRDNSIRVWDISKREVINNLIGHEVRIGRLAWSPDGKCLASRSEDKTVRLWDPVLGQLLATYDTFPQPINTHIFHQGLAWTPDSRRLWIGLSTHAVQLDVSTGQFSPMEDFSNGNSITSLAVALDGQKLLASESYGWTFLRTIGPDGSPSRRLLGNGLGWYPVWHPDSRRFLGSSRHEARGDIVTFDIQTNRRLGTLFPLMTGEHWMCVSPEGHLRGGHFAPGQTEFDPADTAVPASLKEQIVYVALLDDGSQLTLSPDEFAARFGWQNDPNQAYLLGPTP